MDYSIIKKYENDIINDLKELIAIRSVAENPCEGYPFGKEAARALELILSKAEKMGFKVKNVGNAAGYAEYGDGEEYAAVLSHVDVVPEGDGWETDPFTLTEKDGYLYGRGIADDKGAAVVSLYCMKALLDAGELGNRRLRCVFGCGEEVGMGDMEAFFAAEPLPEMAFTPDSGYTVCNREKGIMHYKLSADISESKVIRFIDAGTAVNCVAEKTKAVLCCSEEQAAKIAEHIIARDCTVEYKLCEGGFEFFAVGRSAHGAMPQLGANSAAALLDAADKVIGGDAVLAACAKLFGRDINGEGFGVACSDEPSGDLSMNLGNIRTQEGKLIIGIDIRHPVTADGEQIKNTLITTCEANGIKVLESDHVAPIYMPADAPLVKMLCECYESVTGKPAHVYATGGGTYARALADRGIAFGMEFPDSPPTKLHESNENFGREDLMAHAEICLAAMHKMMTM